MKKRISETNFPWLMSNLNEKATGKPLGGVNRTCIIEKSGIKFGFFGLASMDWVEALSAVRPDDLVYTDTVEAADVLSVELREQGCDVIIAVVHVFQPDDEHLANEAKDVDLVLGGHDHVVWVNEVNGRWAVKAGTDFKVSHHIIMACPSLTLTHTHTQYGNRYFPALTLNLTTFLFIS